MHLLVFPQRRHPISELPRGEASTISFPVLYVDMSSTSLQSIWTFIYSRFWKLPKQTTTLNLCHRSLQMMSSIMLLGSLLWKHKAELWQPMTLRNTSSKARFLPVICNATIIDIPSTYMVGLLALFGV